MARLLQLSDLHTVRPGALASGVLDTNALLRAAIDTLVERLGALSPLDAVLVTGDVSDDGTPESYQIAQAELDRLRLPVLAIPGNHDAREPFRAAFRDMPGMPDDGWIDWTHNLQDARIVGIDTLIEGQGGGTVRQESLGHLSRTLADAGGKPVIVALHHPPLRTGIRFMDAIGLADAEALKAVVSRYPGPLRLVAGHLHGVFHGMLGQHPVATAPSTCSAFRLDRRAEAPVGFMTRPLGCAVIDTVDNTWIELPLDNGDGPHGF
jgi:3',5'-cyclic AMP phosphodiesterase CpdA